MEIDLTAEPHPVITARSTVRDALTARSVPDPIREDTVLVTCELVANAALHAGGPGMLQLTVLADGALRIAVSDASTEPPRRRQASLGRPGGHGLQVVHLLSRDWGTMAVPGGKTVWAEIPGDAPQAPGGPPKEVEGG
ncbi:hypothetical protein GCM10020229_09790 [Kitasatospora albolonga]|uniref:ATP-binding protein n=1 Tax=Kitasatospora albolonga TaxID=68173 RepID=UPI0031F15C95